ncbi:hypothetical protein BDV27DRAFT_166110 [Aspergillus caelatus]|uniref:Uncharacterized protein n=1 Tax=Aspergillus caelatus TaxID=61420 RepID=A0A5N6ZYW2_9EURO|nr:uncharacterized protein BDV27DRAFT_166110 [Aspergillus caelatus]KAE8362538.1 hypothetical protein BDV27DRAFT_166110 [Aspergillus caelatus]
MPISGPKTITLKAVLELFTGTFCIFVVSVLVWKLGKFFRRFTKEKVIGGGNSPARRYTKTWYGWVPLQRKKPDRSIMQRCFAKARQWTTWNSAKNSYCSIWWSSDQKELEACKQDSMRRQSLPTHLRKCKGGESYSSPKMTGVLRFENVSNTRAERYKLPRRRQRRNVSSAKELFRDDLPSVGPATRGKQPTMILNYCTIQADKTSARSLNHKRFLSLDQSACVLTRKDLIFYISNNDPLAKRNYSLPCLSDLKITFRGRPTDHHRKSRNLRALRYSRKYQIWSARMALNVPEFPPGRSGKEGRPQGKKNANLHGTTFAQITIPLRHLSNWEIRLIDSLDRKLGWLSYQLMPGRKPFHFPLLPNHWLNIRTWIVYDPASRAPIDVKRQFGDRRFKTPSPTPRRPKRKYPRVARGVANTPRIESWRIFVNQIRKASGLRDFVKRVELYDDSADNPPDGYIDPACWLIRKPPQGHQLSARQNATYYEGGTGWQERLDDWQNICRGYRIRKAIHEGRANRTRAKQTAVDISRFCQTAWYRRQKQQT